MRRAGLDYHEWAEVIHYENETIFLEKNKQRRVFACSTKATTNYSDVSYQPDDLFLFGPETRGLPLHLRTYDQAIRIPMRPESRSLNLSNAVAIILFEALRQVAR